MKSTASLVIALVCTSLAHGGPGEKTRTVAAQPSWILATPQVEVALTQLGGHMAPVTFYRDSAQPVQPYHISPWQGEKHAYPVPVLVPLRGDFFCLPFGGNSDTVNGQKHPPHGTQFPVYGRGSAILADGKLFVLGEAGLQVVRHRADRRRAAIAAGFRQ